MAVRAEDGTPSRMAGSVTDISRRKETEEQLRRGAYYDRLTGLPNRALLRECIEAVMDDFASACATIRRLRESGVDVYMDGRPRAHAVAGRTHGPESGGVEPGPVAPGGAGGYEGFRLLMNSRTSILLTIPTMWPASTTTPTWSVSKMRKSSSMRALG